MRKIILIFAAIGFVISACESDNWSYDKTECIKYCDATSCNPATANKDREECLEECHSDYNEYEPYGCWNDRLEYMRCMYNKTCEQQKADSDAYSACTKQNPFYECYDYAECPPKAHGVDGCMGIIID